MDIKAHAQLCKDEVGKAVPGIRFLPDDQLLARLEGLFYQGITAGEKASKGVLEAVVGDISVIVVAYMRHDAAELESSLADFCKKHVVIVPQATARTH